MLYIRISLNTVRLAQVGLVDTVDLCQLNVLLLQSGSRLLVMRCQRLTVTTPVYSPMLEHIGAIQCIDVCVPWRKELNEH